MRDDRKDAMSYQVTMEAHLECKDPTSADMKACQETTASHESTETDTGNIVLDPGIV
jgi:hypothetical protein